jgi:hypothetical protein
MPSTRIPHKSIQRLINQLPYKQYVPDNILHIGARFGFWLYEWNYVFKYIDLVGIDIVDYLPIERAEGINKQTFPSLASHKYQFIQGNPIEKQFVNTINTNFDIIVQECHLYTQEEILTIYQNFSSKCSTLYVIQGISSNETLQFLKKNIHPLYIVERMNIGIKEDQMIIQHSIIIKKQYDKQSPNS